MEKPVVGDVVVVPFPHTDLAPGKRRPALVVADLPGEDLILCQITSKARFDGLSIPVEAGDFQSGGLPLVSYIRPNRLFTVHVSVILKTVARVGNGKLSATLAALRKLFGDEERMDERDQGE